jgi:hypothetical protein
MKFYIMMALLVVFCLLTAYYSFERQADTYSKECISVNGKPVFNGKYMECLK